jgi:CelD/BcsL family acetyltransferase involved in cellulose biosynthesis
MSAAGPLAWRWLEPGADAWAAWGALEDRAGVLGVTSSLAWTRAWSAAYGDAVRHRVGLAVAPDGAPRGAVVVADAVRRRGGVALRCAHVGTGGEPRPGGVEAPYVRLACSDPDRPAVARALVAALGADPRWDVVAAERLHPDDAAALHDAAPHWTATLEPSPSTDLVAATVDGDVLPALPPRTRRALRRTVREHGPAAVEIADGPAAAHDVLDELAALHEARFAPGAFGDPRFRRFHRALVDALAPDGRLLLVRVRRGPRTLGCVAILRDGLRALSYTGGMAAPEGRHDKPGFVVHAAAMAACARRGVEEYDLLTGDAPYKHELGRLERAQWTVRTERRTARVLAGSATRRARRTLERTPEPQGAVR